MKKLMFFLALVIICTIFTIFIIDENHPVSQISANEIPTNISIEEVIPSLLSKLPSSLQIIEEEAFEGTSITSIEIPDRVTTIEDRAFANAPYLSSIYIPENTRAIGKNVFIGSRLVTITAAPGSYASTWAKDNGIPFSPIALYYALNNSSQISGLHFGKTLQEVLQDEGITEEDYLVSKNRRDRQIRTVKYKEIFSNTIQGRSPPNA